MLLALIRKIFFIFILNRMKWYYSMMTKLFDYDYLDYSNWLNNELMTGWVPTKAGILWVKIHRNDEAWIYNFTCLKWVFSPWITWYDLRALSLGWNDMISKGWLSCCSSSSILCHFMPVIVKWNIFEIFSFSFFCTICHIFSGLWKGENKEFIS